MEGLYASRLQQHAPCQRGTRCPRPSATSRPSSETHNASTAPNKTPKPPPFRGSYSVGQAATPAEPAIVPLTALHQCAPASWPSEAARASLYNNVPVDRVDGLHARVRGTLPPWLLGSFYRNGPGHFEGAHAVFDGCAMIARFAVDGPHNSVILSHRFLETTYRKAAQAAGGEIKWRLAHEPNSPGGGRGALGRLQYVASLGAATYRHGVHLGDNALVSIFPQGGALVAHTETLSGTYKVDPVTLETIGRVVYEDDVSGMVKTAHPHLHPPTGDVYNLSCDFMPVATTAPRGGQLLRPPHITLFKHPATAPTTRIKVAEVPYLRVSPTWIHQVPISEHYAVIVQNPVFYSIASMIYGESTDTLVFNWVPSAGSLLHIVPLDDKGKAKLGNGVKALRGPAFLATHWVNAFESECGRYLTLDACVTNDPKLMGHWNLGTVRKGAQGGKQIERSVLRRITIDLEAPDGAVLDQSPLLKPLVPDAAHGHAFELPSINPDYSGRRHRYVYGACAVRPTNAWNALAKADIETGEVKVWTEPGAVCWEPLFVGRPPETPPNTNTTPTSGGSPTKHTTRSSASSQDKERREDDGVVLSTIMQADGRSALLVLDAVTWKEVARAVLPYGLPNGFHGCWVPDGSLSS